MFAHLYSWSRNCRWRWSLWMVLIYKNRTDLTWQPSVFLSWYNHTKCEYFFIKTIWNSYNSILEKSLLSLCKFYRLHVKVVLCWTTEWKTLSFYLCHWFQSHGPALRVCVYFLCGGISSCSPHPKGKMNFNIVCGLNQPFAFTHALAHKQITVPSWLFPVLSVFYFTAGKQFFQSLSLYSGFQCCLELDSPVESNIWKSFWTQWFSHVGF